MGALELPEDVDDAALRRRVGPPPRLDRRAARKLGLDRLVHRLHLGRKPWHHVHVPDREARRSTERVLDRTAALGQARPWRHVVGIAGEALPQPLRHLRVVDLRDAEGGGDRLPGDVVGRTAEAARDEDQVDRARVCPDERRDRLDVVGEHGHQSDGDADTLEPPGEPRAVRVRNVSGKELVTDRQDGCGRHRSRV